MGYNSYNDVACSPNSTWMETTIQAVADKGFSKLGYKFFQIDCGWQGYERQENGSLTYDATNFPDGIKPLSEMAIKLGLRWAMYTDQGVNSCDTNTVKLRPGSLGYEIEDALQFAGWNAELIKVDNCYITAGQNAPKDPRTDFPSRYGNMSRALQEVGIKGMLVCEWGTPYINASYGLQGPSAWTPPLSTSFRVSDDIAQGFANVLRITNEAIHVNLRSLSGPGHFADMDLLEVGNPGLTLAEQQTHFAIWAAFKSALMISTNVPDMSQDTYNILSNKNLIAINQDSLGQPVKLVQRFTADHDLYSGHLSNGDLIVLAFDQSNATRSLTIDFSSLGIRTADVHDQWTNIIQKGVSSYCQSIPAHGNVILRLSNIKPTSSPNPKYTYHAANTATLSGGANVQDCPGCSTGRKVGNLGSGAAATLSGIHATSETTDVLFDYINCEIGYLSDQGKNVRGASISVNGGAAQVVEFPLSGYEWTRDVLQAYKVRLSGFKVGDGNTIAISAAPSISAYAPDLDRVGVLA
ncbi:carbohydrate-binding module family 35 protein [Myriangium duriaei CBS 260.36]|uniref:Alpha-galactosidase n=1 Tax=Myriangium duriaei CBS 260.36 TaxID=1168546 RepID=A0A9P4J9Z6_9PEZI|nr:carbohydrate-binding module family 35 protein [Myriangium duriaei CBS 260.36]